ncbi:RNA polymerase sigma factor [Alteromonas oceanisediminis]|uniref:RNA polymerase sigma factor n=1 Tax=Alteromonas oceanisediminis TaxID=2836180 RepID=UPI001BDB1880|nr:RNA polymerase sigma factor [Alteromonas oceanisediminis]MBT0586219.1 RNA polymerase sigma factor [Alteromonas oceanisediminis]
MTLSFNQVFEQYAGLLARVAASYEAVPALQQELLQEICLAVWQGLKRFEGNSSIKTYILRIAHNRAVTHVSVQMRHPKFDDIDDMVEKAQGDDISRHSMESVIANQRSAARLVAAVRALPIASRQVVGLSLEGLSYKEIAETCGMTTSNVGVVLTRAKQQLQRLMETEINE